MIMKLNLMQDYDQMIIEMLKRNNYSCNFNDQSEIKNMIIKNNIDLKTYQCDKLDDGGITKMLITDLYKDNKLIDQVKFKVQAYMLK